MNIIASATCLPANETTGMGCSCAINGDGSVTTMLCPAHAEGDPCGTFAAVTGKRRQGSVVRGTCSACGWKNK